MEYIISVNKMTKKNMEYCSIAGVVLQASMVSIVLYEVGDGFKLFKLAF